MARAKLSLDPLYITDDLQVLRDSVWLDFQKIQDYVNLIQENSVPIGSVMGLETATPPAGYLLLDGNSFSGVSYPDLASYLGGTTLPDYRGKFLVGRLAADAQFGTLGATGGSKTTTAPHTHAITVNSNAFSSGGANSNHGHVFTTNTTDVNHHHFGKVGTNTGGHLHDSADAQFAGRPTGANFFTGGNGTDTSIEGSVIHSHSGGTSGQDTDHGHDVTHGHTGSSADSNVTATAGNLPPYRVINWYIKT